MIRLPRRRFLSLCAVAAGLPLIGAARAAEPLRWRGSALGADASIELYVQDRAAGQRLIAECVAEKDRLERIFSLYRTDSQLIALNRGGSLDDPAPELVELLSLARGVSMASSGAFDVTVQPLWALYADHFAQAGADPGGPPEAALAAACTHIDWRGVGIAAERIALERPGMAVTLNGIAQGYVTDRVAALLRARGMRHVLVDMGEIRALDDRPDGAPWRVGLEGAGEVDLVDRAVATSSPAGTAFSPSCNHIFDPSTGRSTGFTGSVSVIAPSATQADALSTAIAVGGPELAERLRASMPGVEVVFGS